MGIFTRRPKTDFSSPLSHVMDEGREALDAASLIEALADSVVHVPMPGAPPARSPRTESTRAGDTPPFYLVEDEAGRHAFVYSTPARLLAAFGADSTAASVAFSTLLMCWPEETDLVIDPGHPGALEVPLAVLGQVMVELGSRPGSK